MNANERPAVRDPVSTIRSSLYQLLARLLSYPTPTLADTYLGGGLGTTLSALIDGLPYRLDVPSFASSDELRLVDLEGEYLRLFDLPVAGQPCPLYGGVHYGIRNQVMQELLRLYRHFGLSTVQAKTRDLPDSVPTVLEFLHFLTFREATATNSEQAESFRTAQCDLLDRHVSRWTPSIADEVARREPMPFYRATVILLNEFVQADLSALR